jgi:hypothetical protein
VSFEPDQVKGLRNERKACHFWVDNEVADCYQPIVGADAVWVYCRIARYAYGAWIVSPKVRGVDSRVSLREMAEWCGKSVDTVWRCLMVLEHVGLLRAVRGSKSKGRYALADVKNLVMSEGGVYDREMGSFQLPVARVATLKVEVKELRVRLARKSSGLEIVGGKAAAIESVAQSDRLGGDLFGAPSAKCDRSVAPDVQPSITENSKTAKQNYAPMSPSLRDGDGVPENREALAANAVDAATDRVMREIGATARRLRKKLRVVLWCRVETGEEPEAVADRMIDAWRRYSKQGLRLFKRRSVAEFFEGPYWLDSNTWDWDAQFIREERQQAGARAGSW